MKVYRLERNGIGPFVDYVPRRFKASPGKTRRMKHAFAQKKQPLNAHTEHYEAIKDGDHVFGTPSKELLKAYFGYNLKDFFSQGFRIHVYKVPDGAVKNMGYEVAFPVRYHKFKSVKRLEEAKKKLNIIRL